MKEDIFEFKFWICGLLFFMMVIPSSMSDLLWYKDNDEKKERLIHLFCIDIINKEFDDAKKGRCIRFILGPIALYIGR